MAIGLDGRIHYEYHGPMRFSRAGSIPSKPPVSPSVTIVGGGVGGLSAAQELLERGFRVAVYEQKHWGGKVRGIPVPHSGKDGRQDLPGQHGFHFFPGFYKNLPDTMKRIPSGPGKSVFDHVVSTDDELLARTAGISAKVPTHLSASPTWLLAIVKAFWALAQDIPPEELAFFLGRMLAYAGTCQARRVAELDDVPWWSYVGADRGAEIYRRLVAALPSSLVIAVRPKVASTRTIGDAMILMFEYGFTPFRTVDRVLDGPEEQVWVVPWVEHLKKLGGELHMPARCVGFEFDGRRIAAALIEEGGETRRVVSDYYVCALPVEAACKVLRDDILRAAPTLSRIREIRVGWMNGVQFFLKRPLSLVRGHVAYDDSPWALTSISQAQFWSGFDWAAYGDGQAAESFSVIISDWDTPGIKVKKPAKECTREEIYEETLAQINAQLKRSGQRIDPADVARSFLDTDITCPRYEPGLDKNAEQLFITTTGAWSARPEPCTEIPNLFIASDYVRSQMDFASAEGTNEVARRAVNGILDAQGSSAARCHVGRPTEPFIFAPMRALDALLFRLGLPAFGYWGATRWTQPPRLSVR